MLFFVVGRIQSFGVRLAIILAVILLCGSSSAISSVCADVGSQSATMRNTVGGYFGWAERTKPRDGYDIVFEDGLRYLVYDDHAELSGVALNSWGREDFVVPPAIKDRPVTAVCDEAFERCGSLRTVVLPETVVSIGTLAFGDCAALETLALPGGVTAIPAVMLYNCASLTDVYIPDGVTSIGGGAFGGCSSLASIALPAGLTKLGEYAFSGCSSLTDISIPDGVTEICHYTFLNCTSLTEAGLPASVTVIGAGAFKNCRSLEAVTMSGAASVDKTAFSGCDALPIYITG